MPFQYTMTAQQNVNNPATRNEGGSHMSGISQASVCFPTTIRHYLVFQQVFHTASLGKLFCFNG